MLKGTVAGSEAHPIAAHLTDLYAENVTAKVYRTAIKHLMAQGNSKAKLLEKTSTFTSESLPQRFPETVAQSGDTANNYNLREARFWTCGFFPGTLYSLLERYIKFPRSTNINLDQLTASRLRSEIEGFCKLWSEPLHEMANRTDTHDVGFIVMPALQKTWELTGDARALDSIIRAAWSLASRYIPSAKAIRSWDQHTQKHRSFIGQSDNALVIIDSMCNLNLLYYAASHLPREEGQRLYDIATTHADTVQRVILRQEKTVTSSDYAYRGQWYSTCHVANIDPATGDFKQQWTAQGYSDTSTWSRGQAWGVLGYAQTYTWTKDKKYLDIACGLAEYFLYRMDTSPACVEVPIANGNSTLNEAGPSHRRGRYVPLWDFDAPIENHSFPLRDSSAGAIAANGMLIISQAFVNLGDDRLATRFRTAAVDIVDDLLAVALAPEKAKLVVGADGMTDVEDVTPGETFEGLMKYGTACNHEFANHRYANHGIVYGDYYLVEFGNRLLRLDLD